MDIVIKSLPDGRAVGINLMTFGKASLTIGPDGALWYDNGW